MSYVALKILPRLKIQGQCLLHVGDLLMEFRGSSYLTNALLQLMIQTMLLW